MITKVILKTTDFFRGRKTLFIESPTLFFAIRALTD